MLKKHQVKRYLTKLCSKRSDLTYQSTLGANSYFLCQGEESREPSARWLRLEVDESKRELFAYIGVSYFDSAQEVALAASFTTWKKLSLPELPVRSKQTLKRSLKIALTNFQPGTDGGFALLQRQSEDQAIERALSFFRANRAELQQTNSEAQESLKRLTTSAQFQELCLLAGVGDVEPEDEELEMLLGSLAGEGTLSGSSSFSLNQDKALAKLSDFQLGERYMCPLFLASGIYLLGATQIDIRLDSDEIWVAYQGCQIDADLLRRVPSALLSQNRGSEELGLQRIGQGLLQSAGRNPSHLQWTSQECSADLKSFPDLDLQGADENVSPDGEFYTKLPFSFKVVKRFVGSLSGEHEEESLLRRELACLPVPWTLNGESQPLDLGIGSGSVVVEWASPGTGMDLNLQKAPTRFYKHLGSELPAHIVMIVDSTPGPALTVAVEGLVADCPLEWPDDNIRCFVWISGFATDLSGRKLVKTRALDELLDAVKQLKVRLKDNLVGWIQNQGDSSHPEWLNFVLGIAVADDSWLEKLGRLACVPVIGESSLRPVEDFSPDRPLLYTTKDFERAHRDGMATVKLEPEQVGRFKELFSKARDGTGALLASKEYYQNQERWLKLPEENPVLGPHSESIPGVEGEIRLTDTPESMLRILKNGRPLPLNREHWIPSYVEVVLNSELLEMDNKWKDVYYSARSEEERLRKLVEDACLSLAGRAAKADFGEELSRARFEGFLRFFQSRGYSLNRWKNVQFISEYRTEMDTSGPIPIPRRVEILVSLSDRPNYLD